MGKTTKQPTTAKEAATATKQAAEHVKAASDAYRERVAYVCAHTAADLGKRSGDILTETIATLIVAEQWDVKWAALLAAYEDTGGSEGTFRVATTRARLMDKPKGRVDGLSRFRKSVADSIALNDDPSSQINGVADAVRTLRGTQSWRKFHDALAGKTDTGTKSENGRTAKSSDDAVNKAIADYKDGIDPKTGGANHQRAKEAEEVFKSDGSSADPCQRIAAFFEHCSESQADRVMAALSAIGRDKINGALARMTETETETEAA